MITFVIINYFFTNFFLINSGFLFILPLFFASKTDYDKINNLFSRNIFFVVMSFLGILLFFLLLFFPSAKIVIFGDLLPALVLLLDAAIYLFGYIRMSKYLDKKTITRGENILIRLQIPLGIVSITIGIIHVFLGGVVLL